MWKGQEKLSKKMPGNSLRWIYHLPILAIGGISLLGACNLLSSTPGSSTPADSSPETVQQPSTAKAEPGDTATGLAQPEANSPSPLDNADTNKGTASAAAPDETAGSEDFRKGIDLASGAFLLGQSAQSTDDWGLVASRWSRAIQSLQSVPQGSANYETAQTKISEYERNLNYAREQLETLQNPPPPVDLAPRPVVPLGQSSAAGQGNQANQTVTNTPDNYTIPILRRQGGTPVIEVTFNGVQRFPMILDTGASHTLITRQMANQLGVEIIGQTQAATASSSNVVFDIGQIATIEAANIRRTNVRVSIGDSVEIGLLGQDFYRDYDIVLKAQTVEFRRR